MFSDFFFFLMIPRPPISTRTDTLFPYTTLFRSRAFEHVCAALHHIAIVEAGRAGIMDGEAPPPVDLRDAAADRLARLALGAGIVIKGLHPREVDRLIGGKLRQDRVAAGIADRKSTTSELQSLMRNSSAVFCLKQTTKLKYLTTEHSH